MWNFNNNDNDLKLKSTSVHLIENDFNFLSLFS